MKRARCAGLLLVPLAVPLALLVAANCPARSKENGKSPVDNKTADVEAEDPKAWEAKSGQMVLAMAGAQRPSMKKEFKPPSTVIPSERREGWWQLRHKAIVDRVKQGKVDLIFIGDSITQGWEGSGKKVWEQSYGNRNAVNLGFGGDRTQHVLWRLENGEIEGIKPKLAVLMIGTNNSSQNSPEHIALGVRATVQRLRVKLPQTKVLVLGIFPRGADDQDSKRQVNMKANQFISKLADKKNIYYLDIGQRFTDNDGKLRKEIMPDLLHLSSKGYTIWAVAIEPTVAKLMGETAEK